MPLNEKTEQSKQYAFMSALKHVYDELPKCLPACLPAYQPTILPTDQLTDQPTNQTTEQPTNQLTIWPTNQPTYLLNQIEAMFHFLQVGIFTIPSASPGILV